MSRYEKIIKISLWVLMLVSTAITVWAYAANFTDTSVDTLLYWAYVMVVAGLALAVVIGIVISAINNPKSLLKMLIGLAAIAVIVAVAYVLAPGTPAVGYVGAEVPASTLKLTDTILNLTYFTCGVAIVVIIAGLIVNAVRNK